VLWNLPTRSQRPLWGDIVEKVLEQNSWGIFCRRPIDLLTNDSQRLRCTNDYLAKLAVLGEILTFSTISSMGRHCFRRRRESAWGFESGRLAVQNLILAPPHRKKNKALKL
jgi:hypothetical protein